MDNLQQDHNHYMKMFQVKKEFIPDPNAQSPDEYIAVDYAYQFCPNCTETIKVKVTEKNIENLG